MSPEKAALVNALVPSFLGLAMVIVGFFTAKPPQPTDQPVEPSLQKLHDARARRRRLAIMGGVGMIVLGILNALSVQNR